MARHDLGAQMNMRVGGLVANVLWLNLWSPCSLPLLGCLFQLLYILGPHFCISLKHVKKGDDGHVERGRDWCSPQGSTWLNLTLKGF